MFESLAAAPPDAILGLTEAFRKDTNPAKINLTTGVYKDESGSTPVFAVVKEAERRLVEEETTKSYLAIDGAPAYSEAVKALVFGRDHEIIRERRAVTADTPGGTGALRVAADLIKQQFGDATVWLSDPTWPNHPSIFAAAGVTVKKYPYYDAEGKCLDADAFLSGLRKIPAGDFVLLHGCCHNPTGMDPSPEEWKTVAGIAAECGWTPLFDFAYQGLAKGLREDAVGLLEFCQPGRELMVCTSFSKNFGLYNERVGALTLVAETEGQAQVVLSHMKACIRSNYSNPPAHGASIVTTVLNDVALKKRWEEEVAGMRDRIHAMRGLFVDTLKAKGVERDFSFLTKQNGMFSFSGLTPDQVDRLREENAIYIVRSGRINVAGMTPSTMDSLCEAIAAVL
jgi:aspartate aminotransferase/aromatic-amino-acid transaminase